MLNLFLLVVGMLMDIFSAIVVVGLTTYVPELSTSNSRLQKGGETLGELMKQQDGGKELSADETLKELSNTSGDPSGSEGSKKDAAEARRSVGRSTSADPRSA